MKPLLIYSIALLLSLSTKIMAQTKLISGNKFPTFTTTDIWGNNIASASETGKTWWLFQRNIGCPVCNLRIHEIQKIADSLTVNGDRVVIVLESTNDYIKKYVTEPQSLIFISDPKRVLYTKVGGERSTTKFLKSIFNGLLSKVKQGEKVMGGSRKQDGHINTLSSEFIVDSSGKVLFSHYSRFGGDDPDLATIQPYFNR